MKKAIQPIEYLNLIFILTGSFIMALGVVGFLAPNKIATGGTAGLAIILNQVLPLSIGTLMALVNLPLLAIGVKYLGKKFAIKTILCILFIVTFVELIKQAELFTALSNDRLLATLYGGLTVGIGLGLIFKGGASAGGGTILAKILSQTTSLKTGTIIMILDAFVVMLTAIIFKSLELALWSMIGIYATSKIVDTILIGASNQKIVHLSSLKSLNELSILINQQMGLNGTIVKGNDFGQTEYKDIIFIMIEKNRLNALKQLALSYDKSIKMIVMDASEILGNHPTK